MERFKKNSLILQPEHYSLNGSKDMVEFRAA